MSRNQNGVYFLPDGNPVAPGELIKAEWANKTLDDVANALTDSLDREGLGGMNGPLRLTDGLPSRPALSFVNEPKTGLYREGSGILGVAVNEQKVAEFSVNGFSMAAGKKMFLTVNPTTPMEATTKQYVDLVSSQVCELVGTFGASKKPADLPVNGRIPENFDAPGQPKYPIQLVLGQGLIYTVTNDFWLYVGPTFTPSGWTNVGKLQGPQGQVGPPGGAGPTGPAGPVGPEGRQGEVGQLGPAGPQGQPGIQGQKGDIGPKGPAGEAATIVGSFGASKTPADLPPTGFIPASWDSPGNPEFEEQLTIGEAFVYTDCPKGTPKYGHVYSFVGTGFNPSGWVDAGDIVGPTGPKGDVGPQGNTGATGSTGPAGKDGSDGAQGPKGDIGATGKDGGAGPKGDPGQPNSLAIGTVTAGTTPSATITGNPPNQVLSMVLQPGPQGVQGPKGDPGSGGVASFNQRTGNVTLINTDVTGALGYTPYNATNPTQYTTLPVVETWVGQQKYVTLAQVESAGYATQAWVTAKNYCTLAQVGSLGYATQAYVLALKYTTLTEVTNSYNVYKTRQTFTGGMFSTAHNFNDTCSLFTSPDFTSIQFALQSKVQMKIENNGTFRIEGATAQKPGGGAWADSSDKRIKTDIEPLQGALSKLMQLRPVDYELLTSDASGQTAGFIAQEVQEVFPDAVVEVTPTEEEQKFIPKGEKILAIGWRNDFFAYIVGAIQELSRQNAALQAQIDALSGAKK